GIQRIEPQLPRAYLGAGRQLEIFFDSSIEAEAGSGAIRIDETQQVARAEEGVFIERIFRSRRIAPIAGSYIGSAIADFKAVIVRHELELQPGYRYADYAGTIRLRIAEERDGAGFGHAQAGHRQNSLTDRLHGQPFEREPCCRQHGRSGVP